MEDLQMWRVEQSEAGADKSNGSHTLTGWIETPQILSALLNFREMKVGGEKIQQRADAQRWRTGVIAQTEAISSSPTDNISRISRPVKGSEQLIAQLRLLLALFANCLRINIHYIYFFYFTFRNSRQLPSAKKLMSLPG